MASNLTDHVWTIRKLLERASKAQEIAHAMLSEGGYKGDDMQSIKLSNRMIASATLMAVGTASTAIALHLPPVGYDITIPVFFLGIMLIGAGALCPFRRTIYGTAAGFVLAVYLTTPVIHTTGNAKDTFKSVAAELDAQSANDTKASALSQLIFRVSRTR